MWNRNRRRRLAEVPLFASCSPRELARISRLVTEELVNEGEVLCREGEEATRCFVIAEGRAVVRVSDREVARLEPGAVFGEMALLDGGRRTATVIADVPMRVYAILPSSFESLLREVPTAARAVMRTLSERLRSTPAPRGDAFHDMPELAAQIRNATRGSSASR